VPRAAAWTVGVLVALLVLLIVASFFIDEPLRRQIEPRANQRLDGYTVRIGALDFHPLGFSIDFHNLVVAQNAHPDPPLAHIGELQASVHWRALLRGQLVANFTVDRPVLHVNLAHVRREADDAKPVSERGWQEALQELYPLEINEFKIRDGAVTYVDAAKTADEAQTRPLKLSQLNVLATNIRNIRSRDRVYPSDIRAEATVFDQGRLLVDGHADFLAAPHPGVLALIKLDDIELDYFRPILARYNFVMRRGSLSAEGNVEYGPRMRAAHLERAVLRDLQGDYVHTPKSTPGEEKAVKAVSDGAQDVANRPEVQIRIDQLRVENADVGFVNRAQSRPYRVFLSGTNLELRNLSNHFTDGPALLTLQGRFMGSGPTTVKATFRSELDGPDFDVNVKVDDTDLTTMNDLLRAHGKFDVVAGVFSFYAELGVKNGQVSGYVKPLFRDLDVYDQRQDREKSLFRKAYEGLVGGVARLLENRPREEVATKAAVAGPVQDPQASTLQVLGRLIQNAFFKAILPGFEGEVSRRRS
jgi:hypothetical protein